MNEKENTPRPNLPDPFWLTNTELTQETIMNYQIKPKSTADILKKDGERLKRMIQPNQVKEQLDQLYRYDGDIEICACTLISQIFK